MRFHRFALALYGLLAPAAWGNAQALPDTRLLEGKDDLARVMVDGIHRYLDKLTEGTIAKRTQAWKPNAADAATYAKSLEPQRQRLRRMIGVVDQRLPPALEHVATVDRPALVADGKTYRVFRVRWPVLPGVHGEGLLLEPITKAAACVVAIPDADQTPEAFVSPAVVLMAMHGVRVLIPTLVDRKDTYSASAKVGRFTNQTHREFVYRMAFEMGRHIIGYEAQKVLAAVDWFCKEKGHPRVGVFGYGEGGLLAQYCAAIDPRIDVSVVSGYFGPRERLWEEPIYRNVFGLLREFGDAEMVRLVAPRRLIIEPSDFNSAPAPSARAGRGGAAPGVIEAPDVKAIRAEYRRIFDVDPQAHGFLRDTLALPKEPNADLRAGRSATMVEFMTALYDDKPLHFLAPRALELNAPPDAEARQKRQFDELVDYTQNLMGDLRGPAATKRQDFVWSRLDTKSLDSFKKSQEPLRDYFWMEIIGKLPEPTMPMNPRTRLVLEQPKWKGYEVVLDLYDEVICYGILLVPNDIKDGERRPVVVCQHGLEGRPNDVVNPNVKSVYRAFGAQLADRGFVVFAPQNPYIFHNHFRQFVRKANPLGLHIYSFIVRQHERILAWLATLPYVDTARIAYYGLSYGGKVAMRIPAILTGYCLSICSGDFNEWIWKNINLDWDHSYMFSGEYEMYEFDLGNTFNYAEMAALIAPRPFMVERGHADGVGLDEYVAFEYAKVRRLYAALGIPDRTEIEFFRGGHEIHGQGTFAFLHRHLSWPAPK
jgi:cephalosporin-C deacetylase-like acetyl esterase